MVFNNIFLVLHSKPFVLIKEEHYVVFESKFVLSLRLHIQYFAVHTDVFIKIGPMSVFRDEIASILFLYKKKKL